MELGGLCTRLHGINRSSSAANYQCSGFPAVESACFNLLLCVSSNSQLIEFVKRSQDRVLAHWILRGYLFVLAQAQGLRYDTLVPMYNSRNVNVVSAGIRHGLYTLMELGTNEQLNQSWIAIRPFPTRSLAG